MEYINFVFIDGIINIQWKNIDLPNYVNLITAKLTFSQAVASLEVNYRIFILELVFLS